MSATNQRVAIRDVRPQVDGGRHPAKRSVGELIEVEADVFADSHDALLATVCWRPRGSRRWSEVAMTQLVNDRWRGSFTVDEPGRYEIRVTGWIDRFGTWQRDTRTKLEAGVATSVDLAIGAALLDELKAKGEDRAEVQRMRDQLVDERLELPARAEPALSDDATALVRRLDDRRYATASDRLPLRVDRERARFSAWYELFPRSAATEPGRHGTFDDVIARLPYVADLGFDVLYLPPIHPIGTTHRKGRNNSVVAEPGDVGSPWAIGSPEGGHEAIHPELGTIDDFRRLVTACADHGLELALDIAFQCSPDHPWVTEHPEWFRARPDGTIQYAENPPKKYQDIYPLDFETEDAEGLWQALKGVFEHWIAEGIRIFRVDNPHTKAFGFWEWCLDELTREHPDTIFLSESFTRPKVMKELARVGFTQSYTYFAWRDARWELAEYYAELHTTEVADYFRPNSWPNTPDILTEFLQHGGRAAFVQKLILAATLTANYGIYGPPFELMEHVARPGAEEYLDNEKYQLRHWDLDAPHSLAELIARVNAIRRAHPALQQDRSFAIHHVDNEALFAYSKRDPRSGDTVLTVVNLDPVWKQGGFTWLDLEALGLEGEGARFEVYDALGESRYTWQGRRNYVELDPHVTPGHIFVISSLDDPVGPPATVAEVGP
ncbi:alpha-1,4-glucan--maltose-1-phosphate maltosyltransferase [Nitriliruptor alkaliphilus]|uniref:alpha-1,4-glucan--maltose-1-phosphate maltosyltransferase n=1 Tax=Nitriliruptor alkaliphilus TaxID=427918 RepID=UPI000698D872|nr:alpha-1,4-glucan--maltose-1-phosphate maltosyltransferase [Nitriliruptor alkaliphilus]